MLFDSISIGLTTLYGMHRNFILNIDIGHIQILIFTP